MATEGTIRDAVVRLSVDDLSAHLATLEEELSGGKSIELVRGETVIAEVRAPVQRAVSEDPETRYIPDFMGRMKAIWGDKVFPEGYLTGIIREDRDGRG